MMRILVAGLLIQVMASSSALAASASRFTESQVGSATELRGTEGLRIRAAYRLALQSLARAGVARQRAIHELRRAGVGSATAVGTDATLEAPDRRDALERERLMDEPALVAGTWEFAACTRAVAADLCRRVGRACDSAMTDSRAAGGCPPGPGAGPAELVRCAEAGVFAAQQAEQLAVVAEHQATALPAKSGGPARP